MEAEQIERVAVVGAGTMGHGIAEVCALAGLEVGITDIKEEFLEEAVQSISASLDKLQEKGKISSSETDQTMGRISTDVDLKKIVSPSQLVIEAVPEKMEIKRDVFQEVDGAAREEAMFATNTSSLSITNLASLTSRPESFCGLHFFNPPVRMQLVEVVKGRETEKETIEVAMDFARRLGKEPVYCRKDHPGFIVNAILFPYLLEAVRLVELQNLERETVDAGVVAKLNFPMGPFELLDMVGLDVAKEIGKVIGWPVPSGVKRRVDKDQLGRKTGRGFYDYEGEGVNYSPDDGAGFDPLPLLGVMVNEAAKVLEEEVATAEDIDLAMKLGTGMPEGPIALVEKRGLVDFREGLNWLGEINSSDKERYEPRGPLKEGFDEYGV
ncbi:MAG: 3-hydroxyacyl-CoA dehydrogenase NAD-binding domain-containing protein [Candidatus Bipolaricaulota bacterium]